VAWSTVYAGDPIAGNFTNYALSQKGCQLYAYTQGLIAIRKSTNAFRLPDMALASNLTLLTADGAGASTLAFGYRAAATDGTGTYYVFHNADSAAHAFAVPASLTSAGLLADGASSGLTAIQGSTTATLSPDGKTVTLAPLTSAIFKR
jgi:pullulanase/glycogen debranching enzyme